MVDVVDVVVVDEKNNTIAAPAVDPPIPPRTPGSAPTVSPSPPSNPPSAVLPVFMHSKVSSSDTDIAMTDKYIYVL